HRFIPDRTFDPAPHFRCATDRTQAAAAEQSCLEWWMRCQIAAWNIGFGWKNDLPGSLTNCV
ncbi:hypothetical protein, partial [Klebsiella pneumoniae]|uniref:hypothetical protein n=1 Tax=Klebsiella pneumoniae TaxID=573 RepID=UPI001952D822